MGKGYSVYANANKNANEKPNLIKVLEFRTASIDEEATQED